MNVKCNIEEQRRVLQAAVDGDIDYIKKVPHELLRSARCTSGNDWSFFFGFCDKCGIFTIKIC